MTMPFIYVFVSQLFTVIHSGISGGGRGQGGAAGEQLRERAAAFSVFHHQRPSMKVKLKLRDTTAVVS